jgi:hypothetical protein
VDSFLELRPEFHDLGKLAIALTLMTREDEGKLFPFERRREGFYHYLFTQLNAPWEEFKNNKLSIVTFNYDRSLEHYLFTALKRSHGKTDDLVADALSAIPIIHVHGSLGPLPWQEKDGRPYQPVALTLLVNQTTEQLKDASQRILIVSEEEKSTNEFDRAFECLRQAERFFFLGFGYHEPNLKKLRLNELHLIDDITSPEAHPAKYKMPFRGSALNLGAAQRNAIKNGWGIGLPSSSYNDLEFLKEYAELD